MIKTDEKDQETHQNSPPNRSNMHLPNGHTYGLI